MRVNDWKMAMKMEILHSVECVEALLILHQTPILSHPQSTDCLPKWSECPKQFESQLYNCQTGQRVCYFCPGCLSTPRWTWRSCVTSPSPTTAAPPSRTLWTRSSWRRRGRSARHSAHPLQLLLSGKPGLKCRDVLQVVQRLEEDLGVKVQEVQLPGLQYGFQIWNTYMGLPDKEGNVRWTHQHKAESSNYTDTMDWLT